ncbi:MAG: hypothetical protein WC489_00830 [Patescibacteria group bacterium]
MYRQKIILFFVALCMLYFIYPWSVSAQDTRSEKWVCLQTPEKPEVDAQGNPVIDPVTGKQKTIPISCLDPAAGCSTLNGHRVKLTTKPEPEQKLLPGHDTYIIVCIATATEQICTTGRQETDDTVYGVGSNRLDLLRQQVEFNFEGLFLADGVTRIDPGPVKATMTGDIGPYEWQDSTKLPGNAHKWMGLNIFYPGEAATGAEGGQQQGTFDFETAEKSCVQIFWDPYGRVFDSLTLEPVSGAQVALYIKKGTDFVFFDPFAPDNQPNTITNPQTVREDGQFNYIVPNGDYKLFVLPPYTMLGDIANLDLNYTKAYSDIYPLLTGDVIMQRGAVQHRDIPIETVNINTEPKMMEYFYEVNSNGDVVVQGKVSHPLSKLITGTSKISKQNPDIQTPYRSLGVFYADSWGRFDILLRRDKFEDTKEYTEVFTDLTIEKVDLRQPAVQKDSNILVAFIRKVQEKLIHLIRVYAQSKTTVIKFKPIPQYIEGYAYDESGRPMPNTIVGVYLAHTTRPYTETKTDQTGRFKLTSDYLPNFSYSFKYTSPTNKVIETSTTKFLAQNQDYIVKNNIDPFVANDKNNKIASDRFDQEVKKTDTVSSSVGTNSQSSSVSRSPNMGSGVEKSGTYTKTPFSNSSPNTNPPNPMILVFILLIVLLGGVGAGLLLYIKNKQPQTSQWS